jgi:hypothetical protein
MEYRNHQQAVLEWAHRATIARNLGIDELDPDVDVRDRFLDTVAVSRLILEFNQNPSAVGYRRNDAWCVDFTTYDFIDLVEIIVLCVPDGRFYYKSELGAVAGEICYTLRTDV